MARSKQASKRKGRKKTLPVVGAASVSLAFAGGASANVVTEHTLPQGIAPHPTITLGEEEIFDVNLGTFYVLDKENVEFGDRVQLARRGCGGCGCRGCAARGCRGCGGCGCRGSRGAIWRLQLWRLWLRLRHRLPDLDARGLDLDLLERDSEKPRSDLITSACTRVRSPSQT